MVFPLAEQMASTADRESGSGVEAYAPRRLLRIVLQAVAVAAILYFFQLVGIGGSGFGESRPEE